MTGEQESSGNTTGWWSANKTTALLPLRTLCSLGREEINIIVKTRHKQFTVNQIQGKKDTTNMTFSLQDTKYTSRMIHWLRTDCVYNKNGIGSSIKLLHYRISITAKQTAGLYPLWYITVVSLITPISLASFLQLQHLPWSKNPNSLTECHNDVTGIKAKEIYGSPPPPPHFSISTPQMNCFEEGVEGLATILGPLAHTNMNWYVSTARSPQRIPSQNHRSIHPYACRIDGIVPR